MDTCARRRPGFAHRALLFAAYALGGNRKCPDVEVGSPSLISQMFRTRGFSTDLRKKSLRRIWRTWPTRWIHTLTWSRNERHLHRAGASRARELAKYVLPRPMPTSHWRCAIDLRDMPLLHSRLRRRKAVDIRRSQDAARRSHSKCNSSRTRQPAFSRQRVRKNPRRVGPH